MVPLKVPLPRNPTTIRPSTSENDPDLFQVGVGIADMTGPCVEINFMGYADLGQTGAGLHTRQFSRAFIFLKGNTRVVLVTAEVQAVGIAVRREVKMKKYSSSSPSPIPKLVIIIVILL
ncbi:unnamed protein product [Colias eurytheme]|nr:unnamed protein product [Colias eurytheme]